MVIKKIHTQTHLDETDHVDMVGVMTKHTYTHKDEIDRGFTHGLAAQPADDKYTLILT